MIKPNRGVVLPKFTGAHIMGMDDLSMEGVCLRCGYVQDGCEPDARRYECEDCGEMAVYGLSEALLMGADILSDDDDD